MTRRQAVERRKTKISNCDITCQAIWPIAKSLIKRTRPKTSIAIHGPLGLKYHPLEKANATADYLEIQFTSHDLCDDNLERRVEARIQVLLEAVCNNPLKISCHTNQ
jgi:hypothetical protein